MADTYEVTSQTETSVLDAQGNGTRGMEITAKTKPSGVTFTVTVPERDYTHENVTRVLAERAALIEGVHAS